MSQLVFIHGPGAGGCEEGFRLQLKHFPGSLAPTLPGHPDGAPCGSVKAYTDWLRGWLWAQGHTQDLVLSGFTLGACIALQYALDYPDEVRGLVLMTVAMRSKQRAPDPIRQMFGRTAPHLLLSFPRFIAIGTTVIGQNTL
jgi:pimeloyl-ACP methyl ester carboxylesterase